MTNHFWKNKRILITGATGLLGSHLTRILAEAGADVIALVRDGTPKSLFYSLEKSWNLSSKVTTVQGCVEDFSTIERTLCEYEVESVFHLAAQTIVGIASQSPISTFRTNIEGTWNILEAARLHRNKIKRVIIASSDKAYGNLHGQAYDESFPLRGEHPYDVSKSCTDLIARSYFVTYGLPVAVTRCGNFFGPGDLNYSRIIPGTIRDIIAGKAPVIRSDGTYIRDYIFAEDGAHAYLKLAEHMDDNSHWGEAYNFSYGMRLTVSDLVRQILLKMNRPDLEPQILGQGKHEIPIQCLNSEKARTRLNWSPKFGFEEGLAQTIHWYKNILAP